jgi:hypothetical protein
MRHKWTSRGCPRRREYLSDLRGCFATNSRSSIKQHGGTPREGVLGEMVQTQGGRLRSNMAPSQSAGGVNTPGEITETKRENTITFPKLKPINNSASPLHTGCHTDALTPMTEVHTLSRKYWPPGEVHPVHSCPCGAAAASSLSISGDSTFGSFNPETNCMECWSCKSRRCWQ